jgi:ADP-ribosylglycohydrolase
MIINEHIYKDKVNACFLGKNIGGTVGFDYEGDRREIVIEGYDKSFDTPMPNDDLDIQLLWLIALEEKGFDITAERLGEYWQRYITPHWAEYGIAKVNMRTGLIPPMSGIANNSYFKDSNGAWIRSEIWACLAPGKPEVAVSFALKDCVIDHGDGEGSWAEIFCAAMQSLAFVENDVQKLIDQALCYLPDGAETAKAIRSVVDCYQQKYTLKQTREYLLTHYRGGSMRSICEADMERGFDSGRMGFDAPLNVAIVVAGMLYGEGCFDTMIRSTIYFGEDTDCTVGTAASTYGLMYGTDIIEEKWSAPIGNRIMVACLNLGELGAYGSQLPQTVEELCDRIYDRHRVYAKMSGIPSAAGGIDTAEILNDRFRPDERYYWEIQRELSTVSFCGEFISAHVDYLDGTCDIAKDIPRPIEITFASEYKTADVISYRWLVPDGVEVSPYKNGQIFTMCKEAPLDLGEKKLRFIFTAPEPAETQRYILELTISGRSTHMYIPIVFHLNNGANM